MGKKDFALLKKQRLFLSLDLKVYKKIKVKLKLYD